MTGSGKTGLCIALLEEAAIDGIPAIIIDPKGDLSQSSTYVSKPRTAGLRAMGKRGRRGEEEVVKS